MKIYQYEIDWKIVVVMLIAFAIIIGTISKIDSPVVAGLMGTFLGGCIGLLGAVVNSIIDKESRLKDRVSAGAMDLTKLDYELRQKALEIERRRDFFLAPAKVYRTLYLALLELHSTGNWPKQPEEMGLLRIFPLGSTEDRKVTQEETEGI